jgi:hypothetical protein
MSQDLASRLPPAMTLERGPKGTYEAYSEEAFRHFLAVECRRAERSTRSLLLLLVDFHPDHEGRTAIAPAAAAGLFSALTSCVREIDFIGWYRANRVIGAVLGQGPDAPAPDVSQQIGERVSESLSVLVPRHLEGRIHVRVLQLRSRLRS